MNKIIKLGIVVAVLAIVIVGGAWWSGQVVQRLYDDRYAGMAENYPYFEVVERDYRRGIFRSTETAKLRISQEWLDTMCEILNLDPEELAPEVMQVIVRSDIKHGPLPGWRAFGAALIDVDFVFDETVTETLAQVFGDKPPLTTQVLVKFTGGGKVTLTSPAVELETQRSQLSWGGLKVVVDYSKGAEKIDYTVDMPKLEGTDDSGGVVKLLGLDGKAKMRRMFADEPMFYVGNFRFALDSVSATESDGQTWETKGVVYEGEMPVAGDYLDLIVKMSVQQFSMESFNLGPAHYDLSLRHMHSRTMASISNVFMTAYTDPEAYAEMVLNPTILLMVLAEPAQELLMHNPEFRLDRLDAVTPDGEFSLSARVKFDDLKLEDLDNPMMLMMKLDASGEVALPEVWVNRQDKLGRTVMPLLEAGFVNRDKGQLNTSAAFSKGQLTVNNKPFDPSLLR